VALETTTPPQLIHRIGRQPDAWQAPDWSRASSDGTFGNRFDDPESYSPWAETGVIPFDIVAVPRQD
jgi:hypothetical protein